MPETILIVLLVVLLFVIALMFFRAAMFGRAPEAVEPVTLPAVEADRVAEHLSAAIRLQTISDSERDKMSFLPFSQFQSALERMYPSVHETLKREWVNDYSLLYSWQGRVPELEPVLFCGHQDVVPVDPASRSDWSQPPFSGAVANGFVWGRGALDMKSTVITLMEAVEELIKSGYTPERTIYLAFGHDEEIGGNQGAKCIVELLTRRGIRLAAVLDEGGAIMTEGIPGVSLPVAMVGVSEKGYISMDLRVEGRPGHSSTPPRHTAIGVLARAISRVEANPMPARMSVARLMFEELGPFLPFGMRFALANFWLFKGAVRKRLEASPQTNALIRTSQAVTIIQGGVKDNIVPAHAHAVVNCRVLPGDRTDTVLDHIRKVIDDEAVLIHVPEESAWEPSPVSSTDSPIYRSLARAVRQVFADTLVAPYLVLGATDSRYYTPICGSVFRFSPYQLNTELLKTMHGTDERVSVETLGQMVQFYMHLMRVWASPEELGN